ncbi:cadmium-translocating P-type ATPase [Lysobacter pythonis]|uniref:Cadmium-translocating P-type ATPase n=1 Tax=Solilutibacter pythonis TaxID=2483112 RepID=A0A3M2I2L4_9GAMM|nr:heavy metal translocating P-type ATPase [Lysobacter pythonis]RMH93839.1 cadmium-translocating P-type ATPase [Lysobacter pythonis]
MSKPATRCFHCGETLPRDAVRAEMAGDLQLFCCDGCRAAAEWIRDAHLDDYYKLRSEAADRVGTDRVDYAIWDREDIVAGHVRGLPGGAREITVLTDGMRCAACAWLIDKALRREDGVEEIIANAVTGRVRIRWRPGSTLLSRLLERMASLGYRPYLATGLEREEARRRERNRWILRMGIAGLGAMQAMMFAEALYLDTAGEMPPATRDFFRWITMLVSAPVVFYSGWPFLEGMWRELRHRRLGMDTLIATSTLLAWFASVYETLVRGVHVWYDAAVMFVFLLLAARMIEQGARKAASAQVDALARARPVLATRENAAAENGREQVPVAQVTAGDIVRIAPGEPAPADGVLLDETAAFDEALLSGESTPVQKTPGDAVYAGSLCVDAPARVEVRRIGADTRLSELARLVEEAQAARPRLAQVADRIAHRFVATLLVSALVVWLFWRWYDPARAFEVTLAVLVVSCPCALSLAIPSALAAAHGALSKIGVLGVRGDALDRLAGIDALVFDKTGTLTDGQPAIAAIETMNGLGRDDALAIAAALERDSRHPLARAFAAIAPEDPPEADEVRQAPGRGIEGMVHERRWKLGQAAFAARRVAEDDPALWLGNGETPYARFQLAETLRHDARAAVRALGEEGIAVELLSGDGQAAVAKLAGEVGIERHAARQTPERKLERVRELQSRGHRVAMVGDGINDAPVLAGADVSLAMGEGAALAQRAADFVVTAESLARVPQAIAIARRSRAVIRQNLGWATFYNVVALPLAATGHVTPWMAALGMAASSLLVTLNALRLTRTPST